MPISEKPSASFQMIEQRLGRLVNLKRNLTSSLLKRSTNGNNNANGLLNANPAMHGIEMETIRDILEENPEIKKQRDAAKLFEQAMLKEVNLVIEELTKQFYLNKDLEKEIMFLNERLKEKIKNEKDAQIFQDELNRINSLESMERARMLTIMAIMQALNEQYAFLELEKLKAYHSYKEEMIKSLDNIKNDRGAPLTPPEILALNEDLVRIEIEMMEKLIDLKEDKIDGKYFNDFVAELNAEVSPAPFKKKPIELVLPVFKQDNASRNSFDKITSGDDFKKAHKDAVKEIFKKHQVTDPDQVEIFSTLRQKMIKGSENLKKALQFRSSEKEVRKAVTVVKNDKALKVEANKELDFFLNFDLESPADRNGIPDNLRRNNAI